MSHICASQCSDTFPDRTSADTDSVESPLAVAHLAAEQQPPAGQLSLDPALWPGGSREHPGVHSNHRICIDPLEVGVSTTHLSQLLAVMTNTHCWLQLQQTCPCPLWAPSRVFGRPAAVLAGTAHAPQSSQAVSSTCVQTSFRRASSRQAQHEISKEDTRRGAATASCVGALGRLSFTASLANPRESPGSAS